MLTEFFQAIAEILATRNDKFSDSNSEHFGGGISSVELDNLKAAIRLALQQDSKNENFR